MRIDPKKAPTCAFAFVALLLPMLLLAQPISARPRTVQKTAARYKVPLTDVGRVKVSVDAFNATLTLRTRGSKNRRALLQALRAGLKKSPCPDVALRRRVVVVTCRSRKLAAKIRKRNGQRVLYISQLRGSPTHAGASRVPLLPFAPETTHDLGVACPGDTVSGRGECALIAGDRQEAEALFRASLGSVNQGHAAVRLGDLTLEDGDVNGAVAWWRQADRTGPWGRLARARICDVVGTCFDPLRPGHRYDPLDPVALPGPLYDDIVLRRARALVYEGRAREASRFLVAPGPQTVNSHACRFAIDLCQQVAIAAFAEANIAVAKSALVLHSQLSGYAGGPHALVLARHAANHADRLGAPLYGANALAAVTGLTPKRDLAAHLARTADFYLRGQDTARARIVIKFARARFANQMHALPWPQLYQRLAKAGTAVAAAPDTLAEDTRAEDTRAEDNDVTRARALLARLAGVPKDAPKKEETPPRKDKASLGPVSARNTQATTVATATPITNPPAGSQP